MDRWQDLQNEIVAFTNKTFGQSTVDAKLRHLADEVEETRATPEDRLEWADCVILLLDAAHRAGLTLDDLHQAVKQKMEINASRKWGAPDEHGVVRHIKS